MIDEIERLYKILEQLRLLENNVNHEANLDMYNLRRGIRHLKDFYQELAAEHARSLEKPAED